MNWESTDPTHSQVIIGTSTQAKPSHPGLQKYAVSQYISKSTRAQKISQAPKQKSQLFSKIGPDII